MFAFKFNNKFMMGVATASTQIEGGDTGNTWYKWCEDGHIKDSSSCITACDHWNRVEEDTELLKELNTQTYRMSLEWSRLEPSPGSFSNEAMEHYRNEIQLLRDSNIKPLVTLHHFSEPQWFQDAGGWLKPENSEHFMEYARYAVKNLGDMVNEWVTFNEPNVYVNLGYVMGCFPPGIRDLWGSLRVKTELIKTHVRLYALIHKIRQDKNFKGKTRVGTAMHIRVFDGVSFIGRKVASIVDYVFNKMLMEGMTTGKLLFPLPHKGYKAKKGRYVDFLGINYYTRNIVEFVFDPSNYFYKFRNDDNLNKTDLGWDIYPEGIYSVCKKYYGKYRIPIYITENGISDKHDNRRPDFIIDNLYYINKAIGEGVPIERYYHWTLMDNFEWNEGETAKFGLYECDFKTQERKERKSARLYAGICKSKEVTKEMIKEFYTDKEMARK